MPHKRRLKNSKKSKYHFCTACCSWVEVRQPHTCYDMITALIDDLLAGRLSRKEAVSQFKNIVHRTKVYKDFLGGIK